MPLSYRIVILQLVVTLVAASFGLLWDTGQSLAAVLAGIVCVVPGGVFAWRASTENSPRALLLQGFAKFAVTIALMAMFIIWLRPAVLGFFGTFIVLQTMYVIGPLTGREANEN